MYFPKESGSGVLNTAGKQTGWELNQAVGSSREEVTGDPAE